MKSLLRLACLFVALVIALPSELWARGSSSRGSSFSGGSRSSSSSSSRSSGSSSFSSGRSSSGSSWGGSSSSSSRSTTSTSSNSGSSWGSSSRFSTSSSNARNTSGPSTSASTQRSGPTSSATDQALGRKVGQGGNTFSSRSDAVKDFSQKYGNNYKSTFPKEPGTRPDYIPRTTSVGGNTYNVYYNQGYGGYGYMMGNQWMAYNVMSDAVMMGALMNRHNYSYYDNGPGYGYGNRTYYRSSSSGGGVFVGFLFIIILIVGAVIVVKYLSSKKAVASNPFVGGSGAAKMGVATPPPMPVRDLKTSPMDKSKAADWLAVRPNSVVTISDAQGIADSMKRGLGVRGIDYTVRSVGRLKQLDGLSTHLFFTLSDTEQTTYLMVKIVDDLIDLGLYFEVDGLAPGTRRELVERGALWLFQEPANPHNFDPAELRYTTSIKQTLPNANGQPEEILFELKPQGELQCDYFETPPRTGMSGDALATIVEYRTAQEAENPEFLILEIGEKDGTSSYVQFFLGCGVKFSEVDVLPA